MVISSAHYHLNRTASDLAPLVALPVSGPQYEGISRQTEDGVHELVVVDLHPAVAVRVELLERLGDLLDDDARAHEAVEGDAWRGRAVSCARAGT